MRLARTLASLSACALATGCGSPAPAGATGAPAPTDLPPGLGVAAPPSVAGWTVPACAPGTMPVAGEAACAAMGADCNGSGWPDPIEGAARTLYVRPGASGDGSSPDRPFGSVADALAAAQGGDAIALAEGRHAPFRVTRSVRIVGACNAKTVIATPAESLSKATVEYVRGGGTLENLTITGPAPGVLLDGVTDPLVVRNVAVRGAARWGIGATRGTTGLVLDHVHVADLQTGTPTGGRGFEIASGGAITMRAVTVQGAHGFGVTLLGATTLAADRLAILGIAALPSPGAGGQGLSVTGRSKATLTRAVVRGARELGVIAAGAGSTLVAEDLAVEDIDGALTNDKGYGVRLEQSAEAILRRTQVVRARAAGVIASVGAAASGTRVTVDDSRGAGVFVAEASEASFGQLVIRRVLGRERDGTLGMGVLVGGGSRVTLEGALVEDARTVGVALAQTGTRAALDGVTIRRVRSSSASGYAGGGLAVGRGTTLEGAGVRIEDVQDYGVLIAGDDAQAALEGLTVDRVGVAECVRAGTTCASAGIGVLQIGGQLGVTTFDVGRCGIGLVVYDPKRANDPAWLASYGAVAPRLFMRGGRFTGNGVGVNVQTDGFDVGASFLDVESYGNASGDFTSDAIALANPSASFEGLGSGGL